MSTLKVIELQHPSSATPNMTMHSDGSMSAATTMSMSTPFSLRNKIINGDMVIDQRGGTITLGSSGLYGVDRWFGTEATDGTMTMQQSSVAPPGFIDSLLLTTGTADASLAAAQYALVGQAIEGFNVSDLAWGTASAKSVTLSFWVRSSLTGTFGGAVKNSASNRSYAFSYTISAPNTWEYKTVTIPGDTTGTWLTDSGVGAFLTFGLGSGSTYAGAAGSWAAANYVTSTGAVSVIGTAGATFYITGVQLEVGSVATPFESRHYGLELILCQRYYETGRQPFFYMNLTGITYGYSDVRFVVTKRTTPTIVMSGFQYYSGGSAANFTPILQAARVDKFEFMAQVVTNFNGWPGTGTWTASSEL